MSKKGMGHWEGVHTNDSVAKRFERCGLFLIYDGTTPVGTITMSTLVPITYNGAEKKFWKDANAEALYLTALGVLPVYQGKGFATRLLTFSEEKAKERGIRYVRFNALESYQELTEFYIRRGYTVVGKGPVRGFHSTFFEKQV